MNRLHRWHCQSGRWRRTLASEILPWSVQDVDLSGNVLEFRPGPGLTTDWLRHRCGSLTCLEIDHRLARSLSERSGNGHITIQAGDATAMPFCDELFSVVLSLSMLHDVSSPALQNRVFDDALQVLKPGCFFLRADSALSLRMRLFHLTDTLVCIEPGQLPPGCKLRASRMWKSNRMADDFVPERGDQPCPLLKTFSKTVMLKQKRVYESAKPQDGFRVLMNGIRPLSRSGDDPLPISRESHENIFLGSFRGHS